ncbi:MAG TPA: transglutaminase-like domain-containing protein [Burkholderiaceae bacterium]|jgi:regulator of sirC expression with transglutaminase-like and TPR domain|nr:transglutaminase-like domain-containing protein [Burkholderiaceae bacterium]
MSASPPFAVPSVLEYFAALVADDQQFPLLEAAVSIAQDDDPDLDVQGVLADIDALALRLKKRLADDAPVLHRLRALNRYFFDELGFAGNVNDYNDPANSYLHDVLARRRGIPITLAVVYMEIAAQVGLRAEGVSFPGHFLVKVRLPQGEVVIDPFTGQSLSRGDLEERLDLVRQASAMRAAFDVPLGLFLQAAAPRDIIARMLRNLQSIHQARDDTAHLLAVLDRQIVLEPENWDAHRLRGDTLDGLGRSEEAVSDWLLYLGNTPEAEDADSLQRRIHAARSHRH